MIETRAAILKNSLKKKIVFIFIILLYMWYVCMYVLQCMCVNSCTWVMTHEVTCYRVHGTGYTLQYIHVCTHISTHVSKIVSLLWFSCQSILFGFQHVLDHRSSHLTGSFFRHLLCFTNNFNVIFQFGFSARCS